MRKWEIRKHDRTAVRAMRERTGLGELAAGVLVGRGITEPEKFFTHLEADAGLADPFLMKDMDKSVNIIGEALQKGDKITIYGDYDCDGITSTVMLYNYLTALGGDVEWYIPSRAEGYGLNIAAVEKIADAGTALVITVDNGISAHEEAELIKTLGMKLVITDHHQPPDILPVADAILNPHRADDTYPFKQLAGCGVALKLIMALENDKTGETVLEQFGDLAAIGTIGDIVPVVGENRSIIARGLQTLPFTENAGLYMLMRSIGYDGEDMTSTDVAFGICPRINAAGRLTHAREAADLLMAESGEQASLLAKRLSELNAERQEIEKEIMLDVEKGFCARPDDLHERVLVCTGENYHHGVIGIVSSKILTKYDKPNLVISIEGDEARGSARSYGGFSLYKMLCACSDLLIKYGGHEKAAGFSLKTELIPEFTRRVQTYAHENYPVMPAYTVTVDYIPEDYEISLENVEQLSVLQPFGEGNKSPLFLLRDVEILSKKPLKDGKYISFTVKYGNVEQRLLHFGSSYASFAYNIGDRADVLVSLEINEYNNYKSISAQVRDMRSAGFSEEKYFAAVSAYESVRRGEKLDKKMKGRIIPEREDIKAVYDIIRTVRGVNAVRDNAMRKGLNYCKFCVIIDILREFKLINVDIIHNEITLRENTAKSDLATSEVLARYERCFE